ncbi:hypothetical protein RAZWK3B_13709 [Roseobacter sp. AzwK-3b]|nr:hypothetical protein RAZWK3B_13709 [Roseobacter sp. AzwK-3b]
MLGDDVAQGGQGVDGAHGVAAARAAPMVWAIFSASIIEEGLARSRPAMSMAVP